MRIFLLVTILVLGSYSSEGWSKALIGNPATRKTKENLLNLAVEKQTQADEAREAVRFVAREPYVPQVYDYGTEIGAASGEFTYYSLGASVGYHVGPCIFASSQRCQQYADFIFNVNGRDSHTHYLGLASLRWQWVSFPSPWSPMARVLGGWTNQIVPGEVRQKWVYGVGLGLTTYLHPKADVRLEYRLFQADRVYGQIMFSVLFKMEKWVEFFAEKLKDIGVGTAEVTGSVIKGTADVVGGAATGAAEMTGLKDSEESKEEKK